MDKTTKTIINLLISKGIITREEYSDEYRRLAKEERDWRMNTEDK